MKSEDHETYHYRTSSVRIRYVLTSLESKLVDFNPQVSLGIWLYINDHRINVNFVQNVRQYATGDNTQQRPIGIAIFSTGKQREFPKVQIEAVLEKT